MKKIKGSITITNNTNGKSYICSEEKMNKAIRNLKTKIAALGLVAGIGIGAISNSVITNLASNVNNAKSTKEAIEMAASTDTYLKRIQENPMLQEVIEQETLAKIDELSSAITTYKDLKYKQNKSFKEEKEYIEACGVISEARLMVMHLYTDAIKAKVASAYGIIDKEDIKQIEVKDYVQDTNNGTKHSPQIILPDGTIIEKNHFGNKNRGMDNNLAQHVINARSLIEAGIFSENKRIKDLPLDEIIDAFEEAKEFEECTITTDKKGNIETTQIEHVQTNNDHDDEDR